jgi:Leucine-rich repeat (LRR) protein
MQITLLVICLLMSNSTLAMIVEDRAGQFPCTIKDILKKKCKQLFRSQNLRRFRIVSLDGLQELVSKKDQIELDFSTNDIRAVPANIFKGFDNLTLLDLSSNNVLLRDKMFYGLTNLKELRLDNNGISEIPYDLLKGLSHIQVLSLSHNKISKFPLAFETQGAHTIVTLYLDHNMIPVLNYDVIMWGLVDLKNLFLNKNNLESIDGELLIKHFNLKYVDVRNNHFKQVTPEGEKTSVLTYKGIEYASLTILDKDEE